MRPVGVANDVGVVDDDAGAVAALARIDNVGAARLRLLFQHHLPADALDALAGRSPLHDMVRRHIPARELGPIRAAARAASAAEAAAACAAASVRVLWFGGPGYPPLLTVVPDPPGALFVRGDLDALAARRVGIVGTRNATSAGLATARELGGALSAQGASVVSGLARGIDGAAHVGVRRRAGPGRAVAVVGSGPDVVYPRRHADLWGWVADAGLLISEWPPGTPPDAWRFPARNRIIAALSEVLVVVESREKGGSLITARLAADLDTQVMAVPGSTRLRSSKGTNELIRDGVAPVTCVDDVLVALGLDHRRQGVLPFDPRPMPTGVQSDVLRACADEPSRLDTIARATGLSLVDVALAAARLERAGWLVEAGGWFEPTSTHFEMPHEVPDRDVP